MFGFQSNVPLLKRLVRRPASRELCSYPLSCYYDSEHLYMIKLCYTGLSNHCKTAELLSEMYFENFFCKMILFVGQL